MQALGAAKILPSLYIVMILTGFMSIFPLNGMFSDSDNDSDNPNPNPRTVLVDSMYTGGSTNHYYKSGGFVNVLLEVSLGLGLSLSLRSGPDSGPYLYLSLS